MERDLRRRAPWCGARLLVAGCMAWLALAGLALAQPSPNLPAPSDEAKLLAAAKSEGKLVLYTGFPLDAMRQVVGEFERKYPGVKVDVLRIVGVAQYQRFVQETEAGQHIVDNLMLSDRPSID